MKEKKLSDSWIKKYMDMAFLVGSWSKDESTKVGAVIVSEHNRVQSIGYNGVCEGINDAYEFLHQRPEKYRYYAHAEENAIYSREHSIRNSSIFVTLFPCTRCARGIIQTGIKHLYTLNYNEVPERWKEDFEASHWMLHEAGVQIYFVDSIINQ